MSKDHAKGLVRPSQPEIPVPQFDSIVMQFAMRILGIGGFIPETGAYTAEVWAQFLKKSTDYVQDVFDQVNPPYIRFGNDVRLYDAEVVKPLLPRMTKETDSRRKKKVG